MKDAVRTYSTLALAVVLASGGIGAAIAQVGNTPYGDGALISNVGGSDDSAFGNGALFSNTYGNGNTATGFNALYFNIAGIYNTANGVYALNRNAGGDSNTATGAFALLGNKSGSSNTATGANALYAHVSGNSNSAFGASALEFNVSGIKNSAFGSNALGFNSTGSWNTAMGAGALASNVSGSYNIALGNLAGSNSYQGSHNIYVGNRGKTQDDAVIRIGAQATHHATYIAGISGVNVTGGAAVVVNSQGQLGVVSSSRRYKQDIRDMGDVSARLLKLRPVAFRYKEVDVAGQRPEQYGLIAEEVAQVMPELVVYNEKGRPETVAYQTLAPLLLNELQKEHAQIDALRAEVAELRRVTARLTTP
jgi:hypothetical protein